MSFSDDIVNKVWNKANYVSAENERRGFRKDRCGAWIKRTQHGNRDSKYGWEIHHEIPKSKGGSDRLSNLIPLQWENNVATGDNSRLVCAVRA